MDPILLHINNTTRFLLPLVIKEGYTYKDIQTNLINAYIADIKQPEYDQCIIVVFNDDVQPICLNENYKEAVTAYNEEFECYDYLYIYSLDDTFNNDYINYIKGSYSKLSEDTKQRILKFWDVNKDTLLYSILYRNRTNIEKFIQKHTITNNPQQSIYDAFIYKYRKGLELYKSPDFKKEMYGYNSEL